MSSDRFTRLGHKQSTFSSSSLSRRTSSAASGSGALSASVDFCSSATLNRKRMSELSTPRERAMALRRARCPNASKISALRARALQLADNQVDYFAACFHYERRPPASTSTPNSTLRRQRGAARCCSSCSTPSAATSTATITKCAAQSPLSAPPHFDCENNFCAFFTIKVYNRILPRYLLSACARLFRSGPHCPSAF